MGITVLLRGFCPDLHWIDGPALTHEESLKANKS
jgi:hypothetical protein